MIEIANAAANEARPTTTASLGAGAFWFFGVLVVLLFVTESIFFIVASQLPDDRLPELRGPTASSATAAVSSATRSDDTP
jgi:hypothetical protein